MSVLSSLHGVNRPPHAGPSSNGSSEKLDPFFSVESGLGLLTDLAAQQQYAPSKPIPSKSNDNKL